MGIGLQTPSVTALDAAASIVSLLVYLGVAVVAMARRPDDARARTFLVVAVASAVPYALSPLQWWKGTAAYTPLVISLTSTAFALGGVALFHFTQVFPSKRPWIARHFRWIAAAYLVLPLPVAAMSWRAGAFLLAGQSQGGGGVGAVSPDAAMLLIVLLIPAHLAGGVLLPFAGVLSLVKSWREAQSDGRDRERDATQWMLISQLGGGVLAVLVLPMLHLIGIGPPWSLVIAALSYAFALLLPIAFLRYELSTSAG
jgi:hypothetical protein